MTQQAAFSDAEWNLLVRLPAWVVTGASRAEDDGVLDTAAEEEVGLVAVAAGRQSGNQFVSDIAQRLTYSYDDPDPDRPDFGDPAGLATLVERAGAAWSVLTAKAAAEDAAAYRRWLLSVADAVLNAARTGGVLGIGAQRVSQAEQRLRTDLGHALGE